jgi:hypothetical protein
LGGESNQPDDDDLIILVLMLAVVAQVSKGTLLAKMASVLHSNFMPSANAAITSSTTSIKQVTIALLLVNKPSQLIHSLSEHANIHDQGVLLFLPRPLKACIKVMWHCWTYVDGTWLPQ